MSLPQINNLHEMVNWDSIAVPNNLPSLCIPRVSNDIQEHQIKKIFVEFDLGQIERIDIISKYSQSGEQYNRVFIHFKSWNTQFADVKKIRLSLLEGKEIKVIYDEPWFWKVSAYRKSKSQHKNPHPPIEEKPKQRAIKLEPISPIFIKGETNIGKQDEDRNVEPTQKNQLESIEKRPIPPQVKIFENKKEKP